MDKNAETKVSVIVPIYNVESYIERCVRSLFEQTYQNIEYIFVNDCTQDNSITILKSLISEYNVIHVKILNHSTNKGLPSARNSGLEYATGEYLYHCDSDDWLERELIEKLVISGINNNADVVYCDFYNVFSDKKVLYKQEKLDSYTEYLKSFFTGRSQASVWNKLIRRSIFVDNSIRFPDGNPMLEDMFAIIMVFYYANKITYIPEALYYYVKSRDNSITSENKNKFNVLRLDRVDNVKGIENFLKEKNILGVENELNILKLMAKKSLLLTAENVNGFKKWKSVFPEANNTMSRSDFPLMYKILAKAIDLELWWITKLWILVKYKILNK